MIYEKQNKEICKRILLALLMKEDHQESLDGLILEIYNAEIKQLSIEIIKNLRHLISAGFIEEVADEQGDKKFKLIKNKSEIRLFLYGNRAFKKSG